MAAAAERKDETIEAKLVQKTNQVIGQPLTAHEHCWYIEFADMNIFASCEVNANDFKSIARSNTVTA